MNSISFESKNYDPESLRSALDQFEVEYKMTSTTFETFFNAGTEMQIPRHEQLQWSMYLGEYNRIVSLADGPARDVGASAGNTALA